MHSNQTGRARIVRRIAQAIGVMAIASGVAVTGAATTHAVTVEPPTTTLTLHNNSSDTNFNIVDGKCDDFALPNPSLSYWHFIVSGSTHDFYSITLHLDPPGTTTTYTSDSPGVSINGKQAYIPVPVGATLSSLQLNSTAKITPPLDGEEGVPNFNLSHTCTAPPPPVDVCNNIEGNQPTIPVGMISDGQGGCITPPVDVCKNIEGNQETVPAGMFLNASGNCVPDVCKNIAGNQETVPAGMFLNASGNCVPDVCANVTGDQETVPSGLVLSGAGLCVVPPAAPPIVQSNPPAPTAPGDGLPVTGSNSVPMSLLALGFVAAGGAAIVAARRRTA